MKSSLVLRRGFGKDPIEKIRQIYLKDKKPSRPQTEDAYHKYLSGKEVKEYERVFAYFDANRDKHLDKDEYRKYIKWVSNYSLYSNRIDHVFKLIDSNRDNKVSIDEFLDHLAQSKKKLPPPNDLEAIFHAQDNNSDGLINLDELRVIFLELGEDPARHDLRRIFAISDKDDDGLINMYEFRDLLNKYSNRAKSTLR